MNSICIKINIYKNRETLLIYLMISVNVTGNCGGVSGSGLGSLGTLTPRGRAYSHNIVLIGKWHRGTYRYDMNLEYGLEQK